MKIAKFSLGLAVALGGGILAYSARAMTFQDTVDVQFSFDSALALTLSSNSLLIDSLSPGNYAHSNTITVTAVTNNAYGYTLSAMVSGVSGAANNSLYNSETSTSFTSIAIDANTKLANFSDDYWGYSTAPTINGDATYSGLSYGTAKIINKTTSFSGNAGVGYAGTNNTSFTIGAKASSGQIAGDYSNVINFTVVSNSVPLYMQDGDAISAALVNAGDTTVAVDSRDNREYTIAKLADGNIWMLDNLALDISSVSLAALQGKTNASDTVLGYLKNGGGTGRYPANGVVAITSDDTDGSSWVNSYDNPYIATGLNGTNYMTKVVTGYGNGSKTIGVYYNYCAASAGNYCYAQDAGIDNPDGASTLTDTSSDICPSSWHLPTSSIDGEYQALFTAYNSNQTASSSDSFQYNLSTPLSGYFNSGLASNQGSYAIFWSSTYQNANSMYRLDVSASNVYPRDSIDRYNGFSVRCLLSSGS